MPRLVWVFAGRTIILLVLSWGGSNLNIACFCEIDYGQRSFLFSCSCLITVKSDKLRQIAVIFLICWTMWFYHRAMCPKDADLMANSVDHNQTAFNVNGYSYHKLSSLKCKKKRKTLMGEFGIIVKILKNWNPINCCWYLKIWTMCVYHLVMCPEACI